MAVTPIAQRLSRYTLKTVKHANPEALKKIEKSFEKVTADPAMHDLQASFDVVASRLGKGERIWVTSDPVPGQKHESIKATFARGKGKIEQYAEDSFLSGYGFGKLLNAEARDKHVSPRFILSKKPFRKQVSEKGIIRYKQALEAAGSEENVRILGGLGDTTQAKLLKGGQFRIRQQATEQVPAQTVRLTKRSKQNYGEFVNEGVKYAELMARPNPRISPKLALKRNPFGSVVAEDGFQKYNQAKEVLTQNADAINTLNSIENAALKIRRTGQLKVTDANKRVYILNPNESATFEQFVKSGVTFANKAANKNENVSASLMLKNRFNKKISLAGMDKFDEAARNFADNQPLLDQLKGSGVNVKLRYNGQFKITRQNNGREVFKQVLNHKNNQSLTEFIQEGLDQAKRVSDAPLPKKKPNFFSRLFTKKQPATEVTD